MNSRLIALNDSKLMEACCLRRARGVNLVYSTCGRLLSLKLLHEFGDRICGAFSHDLNAGIAKVSNKSYEPVSRRDSIDEGSEPYPLNNTFDEKSGSRCSHIRFMAGAGLIPELTLSSNPVRTGRLLG